MPSKTFLVLFLAARPASAAFQASLPSRSVLPTLGYAAPVLSPVLAPALATPGLMLRPLSVSVLANPALMTIRPTPAVPAPALAAAAAPAAIAASPAAPAAEAARLPLPVAAEAARPALRGAATWDGLFDGGRHAGAVNAVAERGTRSAPGRHEALLEAAARWRRLLKRGPLDAARAADIAGEVRNHRETYLSQEETNLPGYGRAAKDLDKLLSALKSLAAGDALSLVDRFEEDLIHRRSLRMTVVLRQHKDGGTTRRRERFVLPGTTLGTLLKRVGGAAEKPEVRLDGGEWTPYGRLNLRRKLTDETLVEIFLPTGR